MNQDHKMYRRILYWLHMGELNDLMSLPISNFMDTYKPLDLSNGALEAIDYLISTGLVRRIEPDAWLQLSAHGRMWVKMYGGDVVEYKACIGGAAVDEDGSSQV